MSNREIRVDNGWVDTHAHKRLNQAGYLVGGYVDQGIPKYVLYRIDGGKFERVHEFDTNEELNTMLKLLLDEGD
jgi:hypothetical protein